MATRRSVPPARRAASNLKRPLVVGAGLVALDVVFRGTSKKPLLRCAGGTCGNVLTILAYLGWHAAPVARLADDAAHRIVACDLEKWGVDLRFARLEPRMPTPIIVERIRKAASGEPAHSFSWTCPCCGAWLPRHKPVPARAIGRVMEELPAPAVFFFDRPSRAALALARTYALKGTAIVFEPSANPEPELFADCVDVADIVKYSDERMAALPVVRPKRDRLEIQTLGRDGLRFRSGARRRNRWQRLPALQGGPIVDTAGAGDWCTAGLIARLDLRSRVSLDGVSDDQLSDALRYGQALSAWNCRFPGARGGMYERSTDQFFSDVAEILAGADARAVVELSSDSPLELDRICPSCPSMPAKRVVPVRAQRGRP